jgi:hypothetical protein
MPIYLLAMSLLIVSFPILVVSGLLMELTDEKIIWDKNIPQN